MRRLFASAVGWLLAACASGAMNTSVPICRSDVECADGQVCFAEGCGDPGTGLVVEVAGNGSNTQYAKDLAVANGTLSPTFDLSLGNPLVVVGEFQKELLAKPDPSTRVAYTEAVRLQAFGTSELIPGLSRSFEQRVDTPVRGTYQFTVGAGLYTVTATPLDTSVPPLSVSGVAVRTAAQAPVADFAFPSVDGAITVQGRLLKSLDTSKTPMEGIPLTDEGTGMDLQAFDPSTNLPLSQLFPVSSGTAGSNGNFAMTLSPAAANLKTILFKASPRTSGAPVPTKVFLKTVPLDAFLELELGDPGPQRTLSGTVVDTAGAAVAGAQVIITATVNGGGTYRSGLALTDAAGAFTLQTLGGALTVTALPPTGVRPGLASVSLTLDTSGSTTPALRITCPDRVLLAGAVLLPNGAPAAKVAVHAVERVTADEQRPLALDEVQTTTDTLGTFALELDAATWRVEAMPGGSHPLASRQVTVSASVDALGHPITTQVLPAPITLAQGRTVQGTVTGALAVQADAPIPYATVRFFRVGLLGGAKVSALVGSTVADKSGHYSVVLPTRQ